MDIDPKIKEMSIDELKRLGNTILFQLIKGEISREDYMRADIEITKLLLSKGYKKATD